MGLLARDSESERWLAVLLRSAHLAGVVWLGAKLLRSRGPGGATARKTALMPDDYPGLAALLARC